MTPDRKRIVNGKKVEEYYWAGQWVTYVDNHLTDAKFDDVVAALLSAPPETL